MKTLLVLSLTLFGSLSVSAQEVPTISPVPSTCWMYEPTVSQTVGFTEDQCGRISLAWSAAQPALEELYKELAPLDVEANNLRWVIPATYEEVEAVLRQSNDVDRKRFAVRSKIKLIVDERNRKSLEVLSGRQREILARYDRMAYDVKVFNALSNTGLTAGYGSPVFSGPPTTTSSANNRPRQ